MSDAISPTNHTILDCPNCGAQVESQDSELSTLCAFCDTPVVKLDVQATQPISDLVPFMIDKKQASSALQKYIQDMYFVEKEVKAKTKPDEIKALYIPFWVFQARAYSEYSADIGIHYTVTVTKTVMQNGKMVTKRVQEQRTDWHHLSGSHVADYTDHLVCASHGITEAESNSIEPFDLGASLEYSPTLLAGKLSEFPKIELKPAFSTALEEIHQAQAAAIVHFLPGDQSKNLDHHTEIRAKHEETKAVLLPVWIATYHHKKQVYRVLVNGQTGLVHGTIPKNYTILIVCIILTLITLALLWLNLHPEVLQ